MRTTGKIAGVNISDIAAKTGTPVIIYDEDMMRNQIRTYTRNFRSEMFDTRVVYASKAFLCGAMEQCADLLTEGGMELREFADLFGLLLSQYDVSAIPVSLDRVSAGEIQHLSHKEAKVLLLLGADEDHFPLVTQAPGLLTDSDRSWLQAIGLEVAPSADQRLDREQMLLYEGLALPHEQLFISWPRTKGGAATNPARFVEQIQGLLPKLTVTHSDSDTCPMAPLPALEWAGRHRNDALLDALEQEPECDGGVTKLVQNDLTVRIFGQRAQKLQEVAEKMKAAFL